MEELRADLASARESCDAAAELLDQIVRERDSYIEVNRRIHDRATQAESRYSSLLDQLRIRHAQWKRARDARREVDPTSQASQYADAAFDVLDALLSHIEQRKEGDAPCDPIRDSERVTTHASNPGPVRP